jgi:hypothetical protein
MSREVSWNHGRAEVLLVQLVTGQITVIQGHHVRRVDERHWVVDHGQPTLRLRSIDLVMGPARADASNLSG